MKKINYNFSYDGTPMSKKEFIGKFGENWKKKFVRDQWGNFSNGYFAARRREPTDADYYPE